MRKRAPLTRDQVGRKYGFRSGLELAVAEQLNKLGVPFQYEAKTILYERPASIRKYTPDILLPNGIIIETKGRFITEDRLKMRWVKEQHPDLDIRFVFSNPSAPINKGSKTSYALWAETYGFPYAARLIPKAWIDEPPNEVTLSAVANLKDRIHD